MRIIFFLILICLLACVRSNAQYKKADTEIGLNFSKPSYFKGAETSNAIGFGLDVKREWNFTSRFSFTADAGFNYFQGDYTYYKFMGSPKDTVIKNFSIVPVLAGLKYYFAGNFYLSGEAGIVIKASRNAGTRLALVPSAGWMLPLGNSKIDLGIRLTNIISGYGTPESSGLKNGGYGFWSLRAAYGF